jgi:serine/threonine protein kinase|tara:strand:- start:212 stop:460 length:249 start_codon:yes stop_codon:yes gene_type:complete
MNSQSEIAKYYLQNSPKRLDPNVKEKLTKIIWGEYEMGQQIGSGSFGQVYKCRHVKTGKEYAVKKFNNKYTTKRKAFEQREV